LAREIGKEKTFLRHNQISHDSIQRRTPYIIFGFPGAWSGHVVAERHVLSKGMAFATFEYEGELYPSAIHHPDVHFAVIFSRDAIRAHDRANDTLPKPHGISGCGVLQLADRTENGIKLRTANTLTLMGIQHTWFPDHDYVQVTRIGYLLAIINQQFPDTVGPMKLVYKPQ
jgi:hypothetical protein